MKAIVFIFFCLFLCGCADTLPTPIYSDTVGFWYGLWHGMILPVSFFVGLFDDTVAIYATYNNGGWYDFGFLLGVGVFTSSSTVTK